MAQRQKQQSGQTLVVIERCYDADHPAGFVQVTPMTMGDLSMAASNSSEANKGGGWLQERTDEELINKIVQRQVYQIRLQQRYKDNPLAMPPLTRSARKHQDNEWQEAIKRGVHHQIHELVKAQIDE